MLSECKTADLVQIWCFLCFNSSASLDEGSSGASVLSGTVQAISLQSKSYFCFCLEFLYQNLNEPDMTVCFCSLPPPAPLTAVWRWISQIQNQSGLKSHLSLIRTKIAKGTSIWGKIIWRFVLEPKWLAKTVIYFSAISKRSPICFICLSVLEIWILLQVSGLTWNCLYGNIEWFHLERPAMCV